MGLTAPGGGESHDEDKEDDDEPNVQDLDTPLHLHPSFLFLGHLLLLLGRRTLAALDGGKHAIMVPTQNAVLLIESVDRCLEKSDCAHLVLEDVDLRQCRGEADFERDDLALVDGFLSGLNFLEKVEFLAEGVDFDLVSGAVGDVVVVVVGVDGDFETGGSTAGDGLVGIHGSLTAVGRGLGNVELVVAGVDWDYVTSESRVGVGLVGVHVEEGVAVFGGLGNVVFVIGGLGHTVLVVRVVSTVDRDLLSGEFVTGDGLVCVQVEEEFAVLGSLGVGTDGWINGLLVGGRC